MQPKSHQDASAIWQSIRVPLEKDRSVSGLFECPDAARASYVLAHGAGAGMTHPFLAAVATGLSTRGIASLRYQFPYMEERTKRPDSPPVAHATVRSAVSVAAQISPGSTLFAGGKSFGGRMTSQAQAKTPLPGVKGLVFLGFPLHPPGKPSDERAQHLFDIEIPMLFLQGSRDEFANLDLLQPLVDRLGYRATLKLFAEADHSFHVPKRSGRTDAEIMEEMLDTIANWMDGILKK